MAGSDGPTRGVRSLRARCLFAHSPSLLGSKEVSRHVFRGRQREQGSPKGQWAAPRDVVNCNRKLRGVDGLTS